MFDSKFQEYDLNRKVDDFIKEYSREVVRNNVGTDIGKFHFPRELRDFIEAKAVYAELKWPYVYGYSDKEKKQIMEKSQQIFTWELFNERVRMTFLKLNLTNKDISQQAIHRVIERGGNRVGARRGVLFAQEFDLDINVPVSYAIDWSDPNLYDFLEPIIPQLDLNTVCPIDYFSRTSDDQILIPSMKLEDVISKLVGKKSQIKVA